MEVISGVSRVRSSVPCCWVTAKRLSGGSGRTMRSMQVLEYRTQHYGGKIGDHAILLRDYFDASVASLAASRHTGSMVPSRSPVHDHLLGGSLPLSRQGRVYWLPTAEVFEMALLYEVRLNGMKMLLWSVFCLIPSAACNGRTSGPALRAGSHHSGNGSCATTQQG